MNIPYDIETFDGFERMRVARAQDLATAIAKARNYRRIGIQVWISRDVSYGEYTAILVV